MVAKSLEGKVGRWRPEKARAHGPVELSKVASVICKVAASDSDHCNTASTKVPGNTFCGGERIAGVLEGMKSKGRWVQALLSLTPHSVGLACLSNQG